MIVKKIFFTGLLLSVLVSCKKGEDDPEFSLRSRKARLEGDWKMTGGKIVIGTKDSTGAYGALTYQLSENQYIFDVVGGAHFEKQCSLGMQFSKDGVISIQQVMDSVKIESTGTWDFLGKVGDSKSKESINIQLNTINGNSYWYRTFNKAATNFNYRIKELRNKRLVLVCKEEMIEVTSGFGVYITAEYTFVQ